MLAAVRALNRLEVVGETVRHALTSLAIVAPPWWRAVRLPAWKAREARRAAEERLPTTQAARTALTLTSGRDGWPWLSAVDHAEAARWGREGPAVAMLRRGWRQNAWWDGPRRPWRAADTSPPAARVISSPSEAEAHDARKHPTQWVGDNGHLTQTCDDTLPPLITHVATTIGPAADGAVRPRRPAARAQRGRRPRTQIVDPGLLDAELLVESPKHDGVERLGPTRLDSPWPARQGAGVEAPHCPIDGAQPRATGPAGTSSRSWTPAVENRGHAVLKVKCSRQACRPCPR
jgi:transposase